MNKFLDYGFDDIQLDIKLPKPIIVEHDGFKVVRDDLLDGGTKRRAFNYYVQWIKQTNPHVKELVYALSIVDVFCLPIQQKNGRSSVHPTKSSPWTFRSE